MEKIAAFLSSQIIKGFAPGWHANAPGSSVESPNRILVIPSSHPSVRYDGLLWNEFTSRIREFELIAVYVHHNGYENVLEMLKEIPDEKITFIMCGCYVDRKRALIANSGNRGANVILCKSIDHTGSTEFAGLARRFLYDDVPIVATAQ